MVQIFKTVTKPTAFIFFITLVLSSLSCAQKVVLTRPTETQISQFLKISLFEPRISKLIESYAAQHPQDFSRFNEAEMAVLKDLLYQKILVNYQKLVPESLTAEEIKMLNEFFVSAASQRWQRFSDKAYSESRNIIKEEVARAAQVSQ